VDPHHSQVHQEAQIPTCSNQLCLCSPAGTDIVVLDLEQISLSDYPPLDLWALAFAVT
jgi:hypothetical protein